MTRSYIEKNEGKAVYISGDGFGLRGIVHEGICYVSRTASNGGLDQKIILEPLSEDVIRDVTPLARPGSPLDQLEKALEQYAQTHKDLNGKMNISLEIEIKIGEMSAFSK